MNILKSFEDFIFELVSWLYFYPRTLWLSLVHPSKMMAYADDELDDSPQDRYETTISPPLFLLITLLLTTWMSDAISGPDSAADTPAFLLDWKNSLLFTAGIFSIYPLVISLSLLLKQKRAVDRRSLRPPFYSQCFVASPFAMANGIAIALFVTEQTEAMVGGVVIFIAALLWYFVLQTCWFSQELSLHWLRAAWVAATSILAGFVISASILAVVMA